jgi:hypothetical protein
VPYFFGRILMAPLKSNRRYWLAALGLLSVAVACVAAVLAYLLLTLPVPADDDFSPTPRRIAVELPTAPLPAATSGLRRPLEIKFIPEEPIKGFSSCHSFGFKGKVTTSQDQPLAKVQVVVWSEESGGLLALDTSSKDGSYSIAIQAEPAQRDLWVQLYQNDSPLSEPVQVKTHIDCRTGYQIFQINWHELPPEGQ